MTRTRSALVGLALVLLFIAGAGVYLYRNLPSLVREQARHFLEQYGVQDIAFAHLDITDTDLRIDELRLRGRYGSVAYEIRAPSAQTHYNWRMLLDGKIQSITLPDLALSIEQFATGDNTAPPGINVDELMPERFFAQLPVQSLDVEHLHLDYRSPAQPPVSVSGSLAVGEQVELALETAVYDRRLTATLRGPRAAPSLNVSISLLQNRSDIATVSAQLRGATGKGWEWDLQGRWQYARVLAWLREPATPNAPGWGLDSLGDWSAAGVGTLTAHVRHPNRLHLVGASATGIPAWRQLKGSLHYETAVERLDYAPAFADLNGTLAIDATFEAGQVEATVMPFRLQGKVVTELLSLPSGTDRWLGWKQTVPVQLESGGPVKIAFGADGNGSALLRNARLALGDGESVLSLQALDVDATLAGADPPHGATRLDATLDTRARGQQFPQLAIALGQQGSARDSDLTLKLTDATDSLSVQAHGHANLTTGSGDYRLDARVENLAGLAAGLTPPLRHLGLLHNRVDIRAGSVSLDTALKTRDWDPANWDQQSRLSLQGVSGNFDDYRFDGLALAADWSGVTRWKTSSPLELSLATLNPGFDIRDIQARVSLPKSTPASSPRVNIESFSARMFGGQLLLGEPQAWDFSARSNRLTLQAAHWQLAEMVALQKNEDIRAQGVLEGELPVSITDGRVVIDEGYLRALPPGGSIRYTPNDASRAAAAGSPELAMALDLLSDFQYQVLRAEVRLDGAGNLLLGLSLSGSNPAKYAGQPVNFNINLEQNIDPLLQSLRLSDTLVERIEGGLQ